MEVRIRHGAGKQTQAYARFHRLVCDQPFDEGGNDAGMTPPELMLSAIGCCASHYAAEYLRARHQSFYDLEIRVSADKGERPARLVDIQIEINATGLNAVMKEGLIRAVDACLLHKTLVNPPAIAITFAPAPPAGEAGLTRPHAP